MRVLLPARLRLVGAVVQGGFFAASWRERGIAVRRPRPEPAGFLDADDHADGRAGRRRDRSQPHDPVALMGSSLGGFVAVQAACSGPTRIARLVLLAPALDFGGEPSRRWAIAASRSGSASDTLDVFHYGYGRMMPVRYELYADARALRLRRTPTLTMPVQIFQGRRDRGRARDGRTWAATPAERRAAHARRRPPAAASLDYIWEEMERFLFASDRRLPADSLILPRDLRAIRLDPDRSMIDLVGPRLLQRVGELRRAVPTTITSDLSITSSMDSLAATTGGESAC